MFLTVILLVLGLLFLGVGVMMLRSSQKLSREGVTAEGIIVRVELSRSGPDANELTSYLPIFSFRTADGVEHLVRSKIGSNSPKTFTPGQPVPVVYLPSAPEKAKINKAGMMWIGPGVLAAVGLALMAVGGVLSRMH